MEMKNMRSTKLKNGNLIMQTMKKFIYCLLIALIAISCNEPDKPIVIPTSFNAQTPAPNSNRAAREYLPESWDDSETSNTRTYAVVDPNNSAEYFQYWSEGDAISVFFTTANSKYVLQGYINEKDEGIFELAGEATEGEEFYDDYFYSVYPYKESTEIYEDGIVVYDFPEIQHYNGDSYANGENGMIAIEPKETDELLYFQNFCSYLQLRLVSDEGKTQKVKKITLTANNNNDGIAGLGDIEFYDGTPPAVYMHYSATNKIALDCGNGVELSQDANNPTKFWFVLPGDFSFTEGFTVSITFDNNTYYKQSTKKRIEIERNHIKPMATIKPEEIVPSKPIRYKYNNPNINEPYPLGNTLFDENGQPLDIVNQIYDEETGEWVVNLSGTLKVIGGNSFEYLEPDLEYIKIDNGSTPITINDFAFYNCTADYIEIFNDVDEIKESAFTGSTTKDLNIYGDVTKINNSAGTGSNIENINITGNVTMIEEHAFSGCNDLKTLNLGNIETIGYRAFYMCTNLEEANIHGVKHIDAGAFRSCTSLTSITLESVITIEDNAFMDCSSLTSAVISENCTMIGEGAFCNAVNLETVYCYATKPPFIKTDNTDKSYVFDNTHKNLIIYIPQGSKRDYTNRNYFKNNTFDDPNVKATVNWWQQEYRSKLVEM